MFTRTITLAGAELSSFLAAGGQTVNPDGAAAAAATTTAVAQVPFPTAVATTPAAAAVATTGAALGRPAFVQSSSLVAAAVVTTSSTPVPAVIVPTSSSTTAAAISTTSSTIATSTSSTIATSTRAATSKISTALTSATKATASTVRAVSSAAKSGSNVALSANKSKSASGSGGLSGGGIAGLVIGLLLLFGIIAGFLILWRKRKSEDAARESRSGSRNEKGMVKLEEEEVNSPGENKGFDFGNLPTIAPVSTFNNSTNGRDGNFRSASPADMQRGAAMLGIQRPFTPPPGHPAHPAYQQPPALAANRQMQRPQGPPGSDPRQMGPQMQKPVLPSQMQQGRSVTPNGSQMPRRPIPATIAPVPQRRLSSNNPFNDPANETRDVAPPLPKPTSPVVKIVGNSPMPMPSINTQAPAPTSAPFATSVPAPVPATARRSSVDSFVAGDDSLEGEDLLSAAVSPSTQSHAVIPSSTEESTAPTQEDRPLSPNSEEGGPNRSKSVMVATDQWAARKAHLKNTLALSPKPSSPNPEQSPFADPVPLLDSQLGSFSPMDLNFDQHVAKDE